MKLQKTRLQIMLDGEDLVYLHHFDSSGEKNASEVIHELIYDHKTMKESIEKFKKRIIESANKQSYEEVRTAQIHAQIKNEPTPYDSEKWAFLRGKPEDPNLRSKIQLKKPKKK